MKPQNKFAVFVIGLLILTGCFLYATEENGGANNSAAERNAPHGATQIELVGNGWFTYCFEGTKMLQYYRNSYQEGYVAISSIGECD